MDCIIAFLIVETRDCKPNNILISKAFCCVHMSYEILARILLYILFIKSLLLTWVASD
mgnify:FL=1